MNSIADSISRPNRSRSKRGLILSSSAGICLLASGIAPVRADVIILSPHTAFDATSSQAATQAGVDAAESHIRDVRDIVSDDLKGTNAASGPARAFSADPNFDHAFAAFNNALGYSPRDPKSPLITKAPPMPPPPPAIQAAIWAMGFVDGEHRTGTFNGADIDRTTRTGGGLAGVDFVKKNLTSSSDALVFGILGGVTETHVSNRDGSSSKVTAPGVGIYGAYVNGGFSIDGLFKADFIGEDDTTAGVLTTRHSNNYVAAGNINYKINLANNWWWEPTIGVSHTETVWGTNERLAGFQDGSTTRVQGGARVGTETMWGTVRVQPTFGVYVYSDVSVNGGTQVGPPPMLNDEGKVWGKGTAKLNFRATDRVSFYVEGEVRATSDIVGGAGRVGARVSF
jgi:hypothetical protein